MCEKGDGKILSPDFHTKVVNLNRNCCVVAIEGDVEGVVKIIGFYIPGPIILRFYNYDSEFSLVGFVV